MVQAPSVRPRSSTDPVGTAALARDRISTFSEFPTCVFGVILCRKHFFFYQKSSFCCFMSRDTRRHQLVLEKRHWWQLDSNHVIYVKRNLKNLGIQIGEEKLPGPSRNIYRRYVTLRLHLMRPQDGNPSSPQQHILAYIV